MLRLGAWHGRLCLCDWADSPHHGMVLRRICRLTGASIADTNVECPRLSTVADRKLLKRAATEPDELLKRAVTELDEYFEGRRREFSLPLLPLGTEFQLRVWEALAAIPYGHTESYGAVARRIGAVTSIRAVASAVGANALSIFLPCHRVVGADGALTGYAGGVEAKRRLLKLEQRVSL